jgi:PAS domain S-box-containing protein
MQVADMTKEELIDKVEHLQATLDELNQLVGLNGATHNGSTLASLLRAVDALPVRLYVKDCEGRFLYANRETLRAMNVPNHQDVVGKTDRDFYERNSANSWIESECSVARSEEPLVDFEAEEERLDGERAWVLSTKLPIRDENEEVVGIVGLTKDITEDKKQLEEIEQYRLALDGAQEGLWYRDLEDPERVWYSKEWKAILGHEEDEILDSFGEFESRVHPDDVDRVKREIQFHEKDAAGHGEGYSCDFRMLHKSGIYRWIRSRGKKTVDAQGRAHFAGSHTDVTDIRNEDWYYHRILDAIPGFVFIKEVSPVKYGDDLPHFRYVNKALAEAFGLDKREILGKTDFDINPDRKQAQHFVDDDLMVIRSGQLRSIKQETITEPRSQQVRFLATIKLPAPLRTDQLDEGGKYVLGVATDITELHEMREALGLERDLLQNLMDNMPDAIYFKDADGRFIRVNKEFANLAGLELPSDAIEKTHLDLCEYGLNEEHVRQVVNDEKQILSTGKAIIGSERAIKTGKSKRWGLTDKVPIIRDGKVVQIISISRDITARKQAQIELEKETALLELIIDALPQNVFVKDLDYRIVRCNESYVARHGFESKSDVLGKTDFDFWPDEQARRYRDDDEAVLHDRQARLQYGEEQKLENGDVRELETSKIPLRDPNTGKPMGLLGIYVDVTDRIAREKIELHESVVRTFSHSVRAKIGLLESILSEIDSEVATAEEALPRLKQAVSMLHRSAETATRLTAFDRDKVRVNVPLGRLVKFYVDLANDGRVMLGDIHMDECVLGVPDELENMFLEIIQNAQSFVESAERGGEIRIWTEVDENRFLLHIQDNGPGIAAHLKEGQMFELFQSHNPNRTGMGLNYVERVVKDHDGAIEESGDDGGAHFRISFPISQ